jgi:hypothetical protein
MQADKMDVSSHIGAGSASVDRRLAELLSAKPETDLIPLAAWWLIATSLQTSVKAVRALEGLDSLDAGAITCALARSRDSGSAALEELETPTASALAARTRLVVPSEPVSTLRRTTSLLARLAVQAKSTAAHELAQTVSDHVDAICVLLSRGVPPVQGNSKVSA